MPRTPNDDWADRSDDENRRRARERRNNSGRRPTPPPAEEEEESFADRWTRPILPTDKAPRNEGATPDSPHSARAEVMNHMFVRKGLKNGNLNLNQFGGSMPDMLMPGDDGFIPLSERFPRDDWPFPSPEE